VYSWHKGAKNGVTAEKTIIIDFFKFNLKVINYLALLIGLRDILKNLSMISGLEVIFIKRRMPINYYTHYLMTRG